MRTGALAGKNGSIDWFCCPRFDSSSIFGAIRHEKKRGYLKIARAQECAATHRQLYWPETNVLITRFLSPGGEAEVTGFTPLDYHGHEHEVNHSIRRAEPSGPAALTYVDDYVTKPFSGDEFLARVAAMLRRTVEAQEAVDGNVYRDPEVSIDFPRHELIVRGQQVDLSPTEFRLLSVLTKNAGQVLSQDQLLDHV